MAWDDIASNIKLFLLTEQGKLALEKEVARRKQVRNAPFYAVLCYASLCYAMLPREFYI